MRGRPATVTAGATGQGRDPSSAAQAVRSVASWLPAVTLPDLLARAELQTRTDHKYFVPAAAFIEFVQVMSADLLVLDIAGRRSFAYESVYFDTPDLATYRAHLQRRRKRYKIRTRSYLDSGDCMLELKLEGSRNRTIKHRSPYPFRQRELLTDTAHGYLRQQLQTYGLSVPEVLLPALTTSYRRTTLVGRHEAVRLTCDVRMDCSPASPSVPRRLRGPAGHVLVESKSGPEGSAADRVLRSLGIRPVAVSKYAVAVAGLHPDVPSNPWHRVLRDYFSSVEVSRATAA